MTYPTKAQITERMNIILGQAGGKMTAQEFCDEHRKRGWAENDFTPARIGLEPDDIVQFKSGRGRSYH